MVSHRDNCRGCFSKNITKFLDLGKVPLAGGFLSEEQVASEKLFQLDVYYCNNCGLVQILDVIDPTTLFENYFYISSVIKSLSEHFKEYSDFLRQNYLRNPRSKLLEFGCNDGVLLQYFKEDADVDAYGVDPSKNVSQMAINKGLDVKNDYFSQEFARKFVNEIGKVDVVTGSNVFAHTDDIHEIIEASKIVLNEDGVLIVEVHYLMDLIDKFQYDTIYHEHLCYYSITALKNIFELHGLKVINVVHLEMHGGGIRVVACRSNANHQVKDSVKEFIMKEEKITLVSLMEFSKMVIDHKEKLLMFLKGLKDTNKSIVGYGAPGRGTILLNYCGIGKQYLDYIVDVSPLRTGKLMPGVHVPIYSVEKSRETPPDYFLVLAWNYADSIISQEQELQKKGVKFIVPFPKVVVK